MVVYDDNGILEESKIYVKWGIPDKIKNFSSLLTERVTAVCEKPYQICTSLYRFDIMFC